jgi:hypothetical protein
MNTYFITLFDKLFNDVVSRSCIIDDVVDNVSTENGLLGETKTKQKETKVCNHTKMDLYNCSPVPICFQRKHV